MSKIGYCHKRLKLVSKLEVFLTTYQLIYQDSHGNIGMLASHEQEIESLKTLKARAN